MGVRRKWGSGENGGQAKMGVRRKWGSGENGGQVFNLDITLFE